MKAKEILQEDSSDSGQIQYVAQNIYRKMRNAGLSDDVARNKIATLFRHEASKLDYTK